jgi:hypothetical protein
MLASVSRIPRMEIYRQNPTNEVVPQSVDLPSRSLTCTTRSESEINFAVDVSLWFSAAISTERLGNSKMFFDTSSSGAQVPIKGHRSPKCQVSAMCSVLRCPILADAEMVHHQQHSGSCLVLARDFRVSQTVSISRPVRVNPGVMHGPP